MQNFAQARKNMLDCQLATNGIVEPAILDAFARVPRELFLPPEKRGASYVDEDLILENGEICLEPVAQARLFQAARPSRAHAVLNIGDGTGYASAVLSDLVSTVVTLESKSGQFDHARMVWDDLGLCNIAVVSGADTCGSPEHAPYDLILINGSVAAVPDCLLEQLVGGGRLVAILREAGKSCGFITLYEKISEGRYSKARLADSSTPYLAAFSPETCFKF